MTHRLNQRASRLSSRLLPLAMAAALTLSACTMPGDGDSSGVSASATPEWAHNATIYEVNVRQYSEEGTFDAFTRDIPRLKEMGVEILWLMPIHPIGELNRKGTLGSGYSVKDYVDVNPEFGTKEDFRELVAEAHRNQMKVIIDWVANHTAWDHGWTVTNPDFYNRGEDGEFLLPDPGWQDVIDLNFDNPEMREEMIQAMEYWVREFDIDGYRCDVAWGVPNDFWAEANTRLDAIKPTFMLGEADSPELHDAGFDMTYPWEYMHIQFHVADGDSSIAAIDRYLQRQAEAFDPEDYRMFFTTNHDENTWKGSDTELYGDNFHAFAVLSATVHGMPLVYNGQETGLDKRIEFFEKDAIVWDDYEHQDFYTSLLTLNQSNTALWNGEHGGPYEALRVDEEANVYGYRRANDTDEVVVYLNFSGAPQTVEYAGDGTYTELFTGSTYSSTITSTLPANGYAVFVRD